MKTRVILLQLLLGFVRLTNPLLADPAYHIAHICLAFAVGLYKFGQQKLIVFLLFYFLFLELITERYVFTKRKRLALCKEGNEVIKMIEEEIRKRKKSN